MNSCIFLYDMRHYHLSKMFLRLKGGSSYLQCLANFDSEEALEACKRRVEIIANTLGLEGFSRIDAFVNVHTGEVNLLVFSPICFHQRSSLGLIHHTIYLSYTVNGTVFSSSFFFGLSHVCLSFQCLPNHLIDRLW